jgi:perosamine synthetase
MSDLAHARIAGSPLADEIVDRLDRVLPNANGPYALHEPKIGGNAWAYVKDCLDTGWVSSAGAWVDRFETMLAEFTGSSHAVATVNGTAALHACLLLVGIRPGDEVLVPSLTFVATANAVRYCGAEPHFVDCEIASLGVDPVALDVHLATVAERRGGQCFNRRTGRPIRALVVMHCFGHPARMTPLAEVAGRYGLALVEDAAEALGSCHNGHHTGRIGRIAAISFNGNKTVTTGGGGAILTDDPVLAARARHLTTTARLPATNAIAHDLVGFNYRMPNLNAALGCAQLEQLPALLASKRRLAERLAVAFDGLAGARLMREPAWGHANYWLNALILDPEWRDERAYVLHALDEAGYQSRPFWTPMHELPMYATSPRAPLPVTDRVAACGINLPSSPGLA